MIDRLADIVAASPSVEVIEDQRERYGFVIVRCPHDDGTADHALHVHSATETLPAHAYCLSDKCKQFSAEDFMRLLGVSMFLQ
jgi:hypothetical protein